MRIWKIWNKFGKDLNGLDDLVGGCWGVGLWIFVVRGIINNDFCDFRRFGIFWVLIVMSLVIQGLRDFVFHDVGD